MAARASAGRRVAARARARTAARNKLRTAAKDGRAEAPGRRAAPPRRRKATNKKPSGRAARTVKAGANGTRATGPIKAGMRVLPAAAASGLHHGMAQGRSGWRRAQRRPTRSGTRGKAKRVLGPPPLSPVLGLPRSSPKPEGSLLQGGRPRSPRTRVMLQHQSPPLPRPLAEAETLLMAVARRRQMSSLGPQKGPAGLTGRALLLSETK
mmetsp:Transcript_53177/g.156646  ORF Transcript_53177/g.156646 Transcript_53177/m.156646 type:complete len:209 (-) Transcript_53177:173-799(-)